MVRAGVGLLDIASFSRYEVTGPEAERWLDWMTVARLPKPGRARLAPMLSETGKLKGDLTIINWGDGTFWIEGSYYLRQWHMRWFAAHAREGVEVRDISDDVIGFSLSGPKSRELLARATHQDVSNAALPFMAATMLDVGLVRAKVARLSVTGELGYEINCRALEAAGLRRTLLEAGRGLGVREYGYNALLSLRLEKSFGIWSAEFTQAYTPRMTGMDRWIAWDKGDFLGRKAALDGEQGPGARPSAGHARNRRARRGCDRLRAGVAVGPDGRLRHLGRLRPHDRQEPGDGVGRARRSRGRLGAQRAHRRRRAEGAGHCALALRSSRQGDKGMTSLGPAAS